ncbi:hypothetical protein [Paraliomyxa miuraensis]|uniref:hypothetical protein n=1 Tax=Paraliomyxa miuraensis TaxID=376150 RepID=UPI002250429E|nr:hypothetical protein [Paraliomyxa miuraensis]MCX4240600.1 hypothetical protein [Paraliomyxa miuraensis]
MSARSNGMAPVVVGLLGLLAMAWALLGCPGPDPGPCGGEGDPVLTLTNRGGGAVLDDGIEVDVFPPPQGGVFTELDVTIENLELSELQYLRVEVVTTDTAESLAYVRFFGEYTPLVCNEDGVLAMEYVPVGFNEYYLLTDLDGVAATLTGTLETTRGDFSVGHDVVLRATDY